MPAVKPARRALIVCTTPRTGSGLLCHALWMSKVAGRPDEYFSPGFRRELERANGVVPDAAYVREILSRAKTPNGIVSAKVHWQHMEEVYRYLAPPRWLRRRRSRDPFASLGDVVDYCWLRRRDAVRQAVSLFRARASGHWQSKQSPAALPDAPPFEYLAIKNLTNTIGAWNTSWERYFVELGITPMSLYYEDDLEQDCWSTVTRVLRMLDVELPDNVVMRRGPERQSDAKSEELIRQYHAAAAAETQ